MRTYRHLVLPPTPAAPGMAREAVRETLGDDPRIDDALLVTSELVSNAIRHGGLGPEEEVDLTIERLPQAPVRITVSHRLSRVDPLRPDSAGLGLRIIAEVASRWDLVEDGGRVVAWFEL